MKMPGDFRYTPPDDREDRNDTTTSRARAGEGVEEPGGVFKYNVTKGGKRVAMILRWDGNGYDKGECWIRASVDDLIDLDANL